MKSRIFATLFGLPFFGVGVWMLWSIGSSVHDAWRMQDWQPVEATLTAGGFETRSGDDSDTHEAYAEYWYDYGGTRHFGKRVAISSGGDNIGDYQVDLGRRIGRALANGGRITVYVDPGEPADSIVDRRLRWGLIGFKSIFVFVFGGIGLGLIVLTWRAPKGKDKELPLYREQPWLLNDKWQSAAIRSDSKAAMYGAWFFAAIWNLISAPLPFALREEVLVKQNYLALVGLLFPLVGVWLIGRAIRRSREWRRFGPAPLTLDPFPGSIGGHVGGTIDLKLPWDPSAAFRLSLVCIHSYVSGSGKNRSRREKAAWQDALLAHAESGPAGTRLRFRFDVPAGLRESDAERDDSYYLWRLNLSADISGADLDRNYEIPVYATAETTRLLSDRAVEQARAAQNAVDDESIRRVFEADFGAGGRRLLYPVGRHVGPSIMGFIVGAVFAAAGWWLIVEEGMRLFGGVFAAVGGLVALSTLYMMVNSLEVRQDGADIVSVRRLLGIPVRRRRLRRGDFLRLEAQRSFQAQSGGKHVMFYVVRAVGRSGEKLVVGDGFRGQNEANAAIRFIAREFGLPQPAASRSEADGDGLLGPEVLT